MRKSQKKNIMAKSIRKKLFRLLLLPIIMIASENLTAQQVTGKVTDQNGEPLPGVSVLVKGTTQGTITNLEGIYKINVTSPDKDALVFSYVGMITEEHPVAGKNVINVSMRPKTELLDEIVVVGYGTIKKRDLTGSVSSVGGEQLRDIPLTSTAQAITGRLAGVQITTSEGSPDADVRIRVRGGGSITQDNSPLYIVDGFPVDNIGSIPPTDIVSIDVLKDASSTAIYGARGANGVVIITTRSGSKGATRISYNAFMGTKELTKKLEVLSPYEFVLAQYERAQGSALDRNNFVKRFGTWNQLDSLYSNITGTDWQEKVFGQNAPTIYHNLSLEGGSDKTTYSLSLTNNEDKGIMIESGYTRNNVNFRFDNAATEKLKLSFDVKLADTKVKGAGTSDPGTSTTNRLKHSVIYRPINGLYDFTSDPDLEFQDDAYYELSGLTDPVTLAHDEYRLKHQTRATLNGAFTYTIIPHLTYRMELGYNNFQERRDRFDGLTTAAARQYGNKPIAAIQENRKITLRMANLITYDLKEFAGGNSLNIMAGQEIIDGHSKIFSEEVRSFPTDLTASMALGSMALGEDVQPPYTFETADKLASFFGRANYNYKDRYLASLTIRADGSSKFSPSNRWGIFPSFSAGWRISEEPFMKNIPVLSYLKIRASYGQAGNNRIDDMLWRTTFKVANDKLYYLNETPYTFFYPDPNNLPNPDLKWETTITRNAGLDIGIFKNRIMLNIDVYKNSTKDLLVQSTVPPETGYLYQMRNIGRTSNRGIEFVLDAIIIEKKDFRLTANMNISFNKNKVEELGLTGSDYFLQGSGWNNDVGADYIVKVGEPVGLMYGFVTDGFYTVDDFDYNPATRRYTLKPGVADNSAITYAGFGPGAARFKNLADPVDASGNPIDDGKKVTFAEDRTIIGNANPKHIGGINISLTYKGFDMSIFMNWVYGNDVYNANKIEFTSMYRSYTNLLSIMNSQNRWKTVNADGVVVTDPAELAELNKNATIWTPSRGRYLFHSWAVEDGSFLRLNNATIGYTFPSEWTQKIRVKSLRIYATGNNLLLFTKYSGYDPEVDTRRSTPMTPNVDYSAYPRSRMYLMGINVTL